MWKDFDFRRLLYVIIALLFQSHHSFHFPTKWSHTVTKISFWTNKHVLYSMNNQKSWQAIPHKPFKGHLKPISTFSGNSHTNSQSNGHRINPLQNLLNIQSSSDFVLSLKSYVMTSTSATTVISKENQSKKVKFYDIERITNHSYSLIDSMDCNLISELIFSLGKLNMGLHRKNNMTINLAQLSITSISSQQSQNQQYNQPSMTSIQLSKYITGLVRLEITWDDIQHDLFLPMISNPFYIRGLDGQGITNLIWTIGKMKIPYNDISTETWKELYKQIYRVSYDINDKGLASILVGFQRIGLLWDDLPIVIKSTISSIICRIAVKLSPQSIGNILYSLGKMKIEYLALTDRLQMALEIGIRKSIKSYESTIKYRDITQIIQGMAMMGFKWKYLSIYTSDILSESIYKKSSFWRSQLSSISISESSTLSQQPIQSTHEGYTKQYEDDERVKKLVEIVKDISSSFYYLSRLDLPYSAMATYSNTTIDITTSNMDSIINFDLNLDIDVNPNTGNSFHQRVDVDTTKSIVTMPAPIRASILLGLKILSGYQNMEDIEKHYAKADEKLLYGTTPINKNQKNIGYKRSKSNTGGTIGIDVNTASTVVQFNTASSILRDIEELFNSSEEKENNEKNGAIDHIDTTLTIKKHKHVSKSTISKPSSQIISKVDSPFNYVNSNNNDSDNQYQDDDNDDDNDNDDDDDDDGNNRSIKENNNDSNNNMLPDKISDSMADLFLINTSMLTKESNESLSYSLSNILYSLSQFREFHISNTNSPNLMFSNIQPIESYVWKCVELYSTGHTLKSLAITVLSMGKMGIRWNTINYVNAKQVLSQSLNKLLESEVQRMNTTGSMNNMAGNSLSLMQSLSNLLYGLSLMGLNWNSLDKQTKSYVIGFLDCICSVTTSLESYYNLLYAMYTIGIDNKSLSTELSYKLFHRLVDIGLEETKDNNISYNNNDNDNDNSDDSLSNDIVLDNMKTKYGKYISIGMKIFTKLCHKGVIDDNLLKSIPILITRVILSSELAGQSLCMLWESIGFMIESITENSMVSNAMMTLFQYMIEKTINILEEDKIDSRAASTIFYTIGELNLWNQTFGSDMKSDTRINSLKTIPYRIMQPIYQKLTGIDQLKRLLLENFLLYTKFPFNQCNPSNNQSALEFPTQIKINQISNRVNNRINPRDSMLYSMAVNKLGYDDWHEIPYELQYAILSNAIQSIPNTKVYEFVPIVESLTQYHHIFDPAYDFHSLLRMNRQEGGKKPIVDEIIWTMKEELRTIIFDHINQILPFLCPLDCSAIIIALHHMHMYSLWDRKEEIPYYAIENYQNKDRYLPIDTSIALWDKILTISTSPSSRPSILSDGIMYDSPYLIDITEPNHPSYARTEETGIETAMDVAAAAAIDLTSNSPSSSYRQQRLNGIHVLKLLEMTNTSYSTLSDASQQNLISKLVSQLNPSKSKAVPYATTGYGNNPSMEEMLSILYKFHRIGFPVYSDLPADLQSVLHNNIKTCVTRCKRKLALETDRHRYMAMTKIIKTLVLYLKRFGYDSKIVDHIKV